MKRNSLVKIFLSVLIIATAFSAHAQRYDSLLKKLDAEYPQEKLYLQFDRNAYNAGETIWFKAYLFCGVFNSFISKTLYAELIDEKGKVLQRKTSPMFLSGAAAAFDLPPNYPGSLVYVRAYTQWMLNFDSSYLYMKAIPVLSAKKSPSQKIIPPAVSLHFFPEGGDLIQNVESRVAFKAADNKGLPVRISGEVTDSKGKKITSFSSVHDGMGYFTLQPAAGEQYKAKWKDEQGKMHETVLPAAKASGIVLEANNMGTRIDYTLKRGDEIPPSLNYVIIIAQMNQQLLYRARINMTTKKLVKADISLENLPAGIVQITLFTDDERPLAERIVFANQNDYYFITDLHASLKNFDKRKKNVIQIDVPDTITCNLSIAVTDAALNPPHNAEADIFSGILLTSEIKGYVHNPAYYFSGTQDSIAQHLDLVMMTNGWRRFKWTDVLAGRWPVVRYLPEDYIGIVGNVFGLTKSELTDKDLTGILEIKKDNQQFLNIPLQPDGKFNLSGLIFFDTARLFYQINNDKNKRLTSKASFNISSGLLKESLKWQPDTAFAANLYKPDTTVLVKNKQVAEKLQAQNESILNQVKTLQEVVVTTKQKSRREIMDEEYTSGFFSGGDNYTFLTEDDPFANSSLSVLQYLQGKVAGLQITVNGADASLSWRGGTPGLFMNEMQTDVQMIQSLPMTDVAMIKVFRPPFFGSPGGGSGGAIAVYTKKGAALNNNVKGLDFVKLTGYSAMREFYSPDYSVENQSNPAEDYRPTLYWNPYLITNKANRRLQLTFYNNDITKKFRVVIEGINAEGKLTRTEKIIE